MNRYFKLIINIFIITSLLFSPLFNQTYAANSNNYNDDISIGAGDHWESFYLNLKKDGTVWAWGDNSYGQLGDGTNENHNKPVQVKGLTDIVGISAGRDYSLAVKKDGTVWGWGDNSYGQLGIKDVEQINIPVKLETINDVIAVAAGDFDSIAIKKDGTVWSWGLDSLVPTQIQGLENIVAIEAEGLQFIALKNDGTLWDWRRTRTRIMDGFTTPSQIKGISDVAAISLNNHTLALKKDGTVWAWGNNYDGELGDGTKQNRTTPVKVKGLSDVIDITAGKMHSIAVKKDGTVWAWGDNSYGQNGVKLEKEWIDPKD